MNLQKRLKYLEEEWGQYPSISAKTHVWGEVKTEFSKVTSGAKPKFDVFSVGGRVLEVLRSPLSESVDQVAVDFSGETVYMKTDMLPSDQKEIVNDVLASGDLLLVKVEWQHVYTSGLFPKIENIAPTDLQILAPAKTEFSSIDYSVKRQKQWSLFNKILTDFFEFLDFQRVRTPTLVESPGLEPFLDVFSTEFRFGSQTKTFYLPTSPEFSLKKLLAQGFDRIYEIKESFRNQELTKHHQPEFLMLEWYRAYSNLDAIAKDVRGLFNYIKLHWPEAIKAWGALRETTVAELFLEYCAFDLRPTTTKEELCKLAERLTIVIDGTDEWDDIFFKIFLEKIEKNLGHSGPVIVRNYPPTQAAWARITTDGWADRFEVYWRGVELANAFHELNDPVEQRQRFDEANNKRAKLGRPIMPIDEDLIKSLEFGFPPSGGIALGVERLFMLLVDESDISRVRPFSIVAKD